MLDRLTGLEVFARVAGAGSLSAAARALGMSQTMVTKHIAALEGRLGVKLFHRTTRRLSITEAGRNYLESSARILAELEAADAAVAADRVEPRGLLRLNAPVSFGTRQIAPLLAEFAARHPRVTVELGLNDRLVDLVEEGWDLAIRIGNLSSSSLIARRIAPCRIAVCAAPSYLKSRGTPRTVASLADHNCLGYTLSQRTPIDRWVFGAGADFSVQISGICARTMAMRCGRPRSRDRGSSTSRPSSWRTICALADWLRSLWTSRMSNWAASMPCFCPTAIRRQGCARSSTSSRAGLRRNPRGIVSLLRHADAAVRRDEICATEQGASQAPLRSLRQEPPGLAGRPCSFHAGGDYSPSVPIA